MRIGFRSVLAAAFTLTAVVSWAATNTLQTVNTRQTAQADSVDKLTRAGACAASAYHVATGENARLTVENDGGWCWADTHERSYWRTLSANNVAVTNPPKHGHVLVGDIDNQEIRIAYRPDPGFTGTDSFMVHYQVNERDLMYSVTVSSADAGGGPLRPGSVLSSTGSPQHPSTAGTARDGWMIAGQSRSRL
jgi:hypothetical protein